MDFLHVILIYSLWVGHPQGNTLVFQQGHGMALLYLVLPKKHLISLKITVIEGTRSLPKQGDD